MVLYWVETSCVNKQAHVCAFVNIRGEPSQCKENSAGRLRPLCLLSCSPLLKARGQGSPFLKWCEFNWDDTVTAVAAESESVFCF